MRKDFNYRSFKLVNGVDIESGVKVSSIAGRGPAFYNRLGISSQLTPRFSILNSVSYFNQKYIETIIVPPRNGEAPRKVTNDIPISDFQYSFKLTSVITKKSLAKIGFTYLKSGAADSIQHSQIATIAYKYFIANADVQVEANIGKLDDKKFGQYSITANIFPLGNTNLYAGIRASYRIADSTKHFNFVPSLGLKII